METSKTSKKTSNAECNFNTTVECLQSRGYNVKVEVEQDADFGDKTTASLSGSNGCTHVSLFITLLRPGGRFSTRKRTAVRKFARITHRNERSKTIDYGSALFWLNRIKQDNAA